MKRSRIYNYSSSHDGTGISYEPYPFDDGICVTGAVVKGVHGDKETIVRPRVITYETHVQLQVRCPDALKCVHVTLRQVGRNVSARANWARYADPTKNLGYNFDFGEHCEAQLVTDVDGQGYGVANLSLCCDVHDKRNRRRAQRISFDKFLTSEFQTVLENVSLKNVRITGAILKGAWVPDAPLAKPMCITHEVRIQVQSPDLDQSECGQMVVWRLNDGKHGSKQGVSVENGCFSFGRMCTLRISALVDSHTQDSPRVVVRVLPSPDIVKSEIRVGLHWLNENGSWGGWIADKMPLPEGDDVWWQQASFSVDEIAAKLPRGVNKVYPVVFCAPGGEYDRSYFKTDLQDAQYHNVVVELYKVTMDAVDRRRRALHSGESAGATTENDTRSSRAEKKRLQRRDYERKLQSLKESTHIFIDGNNFCWDNMGEKSEFIGIGRIDRLLAELERPDVRARIPKADVRLFFDGSITKVYYYEFIQRLNHGNVRICPGEADQKLKEESEGIEAETFFVSIDHFDDYYDCDVVAAGRLLRPRIDNAVEIKELGIKFPYIPDCMAHKPIPSWESQHLPIGKDVWIRACCNNMYFCADVTAEQGARIVKANRVEVSDWEEFTMIMNDDGTVSFRSKANGKYVSAVIDGDGHLGAWVDKIDAWEKFWLTKRKGHQNYALRSFANMKYVSVNPLEGTVRASADVADAWEWLEMEPSLRK